MTGLFLKIVNMSIAASWIVLAALILRPALMKTPKWICVLFWGLAAVRLVCPFTVESALSLLPSAEAIPVAAAPTLAAGIDAADYTVNPAVVTTSAPAPGTNVPTQTAAVMANIWLLGAAAMLIYTALSYWRVRRQTETAVLYRDNIFQSENVSSPFVLGVIRPRIYLPFQADRQMLEYAVAHEQAHISRRDHWWKPLGFLLLTVHWFNPLIWLAYALLCRDIELACDEKVVRTMDSEQRADYTQTLVSFSVDQRRIAACPLAFGETAVKKRIKSVMNYREPAFWFIVLAAAACIAVSVCLLTDPPRQERAELPDSIPAAIKWFDYLDAPQEEMDFSSRLEYNLPAFENVTFFRTAERMEAVNDIGTTLLYTGMPIWNAYFCDLNGDDLPELCSTVAWGSGIIDSRVIIVDYAHGATYTLEDRGVYDYALRLDERSGQLCVDKTEYETRAPISTGRLSLEGNGICLAENDTAKNADETCGYEPKGVSGDNVKELSTLDRGMIWTDGLAFDALPPGEEIVSSSEIAIENDGGSLLLTITWGRAGLFLEYGVRAENGTEYFQEKQGGISTLKIENLPEGVYRLYVKNSDAYHGLPAYEQPENFDVNFNATGSMLYSIVE